MKLNLVTPYGDRYIIDPETGNMIQENRFRNGDSFSNQWKFKGLRHTQYNWFIPLNSLTPEKVKSMQWKFKTSNNPIWTVQDLDYGTTRVWGNTKVHGVARMYFSD